MTRHARSSRALDIDSVSKQNARSRDKTGGQALYILNTHRAERGLSLRPTPPENE